MQRTAGIYARLSRDRNGLSRSIDDQERECRDLATRLGWAVAPTVYRDSDVPASEAQSRRKKKRKGYAALIQDLEAGTINAVLTWETQRLYRHPRDLEDLIDLLEDRDIEIETYRSGGIDLKTSSGRMVARMLAAHNKAEVEDASDRQRKSKRSLAARGVSHGGQRPFGLEAVAVVDPVRNTTRQVLTNRLVQAEADAIVDAARRVLDGASTSSIARLWNRQGLRTGRGNTWDHHTVTQVLRNPRIAGIRRHRPKDGPETQTRAAWPAIIDGATYNRLLDALDPAKRRAYEGRGEQRLLTGLALCQECGASCRTHYIIVPVSERELEQIRSVSPLEAEAIVARGKKPVRVVKRNKNGVKKKRVRHVYTRTARTYQCSNGQHAAIRADIIESFVSREAFGGERFLDDPALVTAVSDVPSELAARRDGLQRRLDDLTDAFTSGEIDKSQLARGSVGLRAALDEVEAEIAAHAAPRPRATTWEELHDLPPIDTPEWWARARAELEEMVAGIVIYPAARRKVPVHERVMIVWRPGVVYRPVELPDGA